MLCASRSGAGSGANGASAEIRGEPHPGGAARPPPIPEAEIIRQLGAHEDVAEKIYSTYDFSQTVRLEEVTNPDSSGGEGGKLVATGQDYVRPDGARFWRATGPTVSTLKGTPMLLDDLRPAMTLPLFFLTSSETGNYNFLYAGQDKLDDLNTYVFQVKPKQVSRNRVYFEGAIWVDDPRPASSKHSANSFLKRPTTAQACRSICSRFTARIFSAKYWLPTYIVSDSTPTAEEDNESHMQLVCCARRDSR